MGWLLDNYEKAIDDLVLLSRGKKSIWTIFSSVRAISLLALVVSAFLLLHGLGLAGSMCKRGIDVLAYFFQDRNSARTIFYGVGAALFVSLIVFMFSMQFTGTNHPEMIAGNDNFSFSYAGNPTYAFLFSNWESIGINGINQTTANIDVYGESDIALFPRDKDYTPPPLSGHPVIRESDHYLLRTGPGDIVHVDVDIDKIDKFDYNLLMAYNKNTKMKDTAATNAPINTTHFQLTKRGDDQYKLWTDFNNNAPKSIEIKSGKEYDYPVTVSFINSTMESTGHNINSVDKIVFTGRVGINSTGRMITRIPLSEISPIAMGSLNGINLNNTKGNLDVRHIKYECSEADNINVTFVNNTTTFKVVNGKVIVSGRAKSLDFRELSFHTPWSVILKEGNFAFIVGLLSSFFTMFLQRLFSRRNK